MKRILCLVALSMLASVRLLAVDLTRCTIVYSESDHPMVAHMASVLADDVERVSGCRPAVSERQSRSSVFLSTVAHSGRHPELLGQWERYAIDVCGRNIYVTGSDPRGLAYGVLHISEAIGVSPWYWFADVPVPHHDRVLYSESCVSHSPSIRYRGLFINDEDWGLFPWAANNYERELGDVGPRTYERVCELILRLRGNMLAPAMHSCTGAFYTHPENQLVADRWGIMITTSHCEPLLVNNASHFEWDRAVDGEWNYVTNGERIRSKFEQRIGSTAHFDNIYTTGIRGLHDEAMKGSADNTVRARTLERVIADQREILSRHKGLKADAIPQIFVPYKEALDIYDAGLRVPDDITLVWPDDNYGYLKRVSDASERLRSGRSGIYYHLSYLGLPHDNLWIATTAPALMYEELRKAYSSGADRYWLLNVGDIKPMEMETQHFFDMAFDFSDFSFDNANRYQAAWLARIFGEGYHDRLQFLLDEYYQLAWRRKPEFMGYEWEWDTEENCRLHDTDFTDDETAVRLSRYDAIAMLADSIMHTLPAPSRDAFFQLLGYSVLSASQMNRKFLYAHQYHKYARRQDSIASVLAFDSISSLQREYNAISDGKWRGMMSELPPGWCAKYQLMPVLDTAPTDAYSLPADRQRPHADHNIDLSVVSCSAPFRLIEGLGTDWVGLQLGEPLDFEASGSVCIPLTIPASADSIDLHISCLPMWPVSRDRGNAFLLSFDGSEPVRCENVFREWSYEWKMQVLENSADFVVRFPLRTTAEHKVTLTIADPGQIVQRIGYTLVR